MTSTLTLPPAPTQINGGSTTGVGITSKGDAADNGSGGSESLCTGGGAGRNLGSGGLPCRGAVLLLDVLKNLGVCVLVLLYLFLGAFMFLAMNGEIWNGGQPVDVSAVSPGTTSNTTDTTAISSTHSVALREHRIQTIDRIWEITVNLNILYRDNWTELAGREITKFQEELLHVLEEERSTGAVRRARVRPIRWSFAQAFLFSLTVITTIGYGSLTPSTPLGKMATMLYAALGIPLMLLYLSAVGGLLARCARGVFTRALCCCLCSKCGYCCYDERQMQDRERRMRRRRQELELKLQQMRLQAPYYVSGVAPPPPPPPPRRSSHHEKMDLLSAGWSGPVIAPILLCAAIMILYVGGGAAALLALRACPFLDCVYFCFMSLTTIGFGRLAPGSALAPPAADAALWFCSVYILAGMALTTMCCNVIYSVLLHALKHAAKK